MVGQKLYPNLVEAVVEALQRIFEDKQYADKVIQQALKSNPKWGARDRAFIAETTYEIVRWYRLLYEVYGKQPTSEQDWWGLVGILQLSRKHSLPNWKEFQHLDTAVIERRLKKIKAVRKIKESIPDWLDALGEQELQENWWPTLHALNTPAPVVLRTNLLKTKTELLQQQLEQDKVQTQQLNEEALLVTERQNLFRTKAFQEGWFEVQDFSSQQVAHFLDIEPGMRVVDACAGGGGKSLHLATLMENKGRIISMDTEDWKLQELRKRARRAGISIIETRTIDNSKIIKRLDKSADRLLLDVPCSGLGVLRRNPDAKWKLSPEFVQSVKDTQHDILTTYSRMCRIGGKLVYATCSILPSENNQQVQRFLNEQGGAFELENEKNILPQDEGFDGFYMALLSRKK